MNKQKHAAISYPLSLIFLLAIPFLALADETLSITTYYPSPYGSYNSLQINMLGVGDNNGDGILTSADVPTTPGNVWIKGLVGIGTMSPSVKLHIAGTSAVNGSQAAIYLEDTAGDTDSRTWAIQNNATGYNLFGTLSFNVSSTAGGVPSSTPSMAIDKNGYVAIGTTTPKAPLYVVATSSSPYSGMATDAEHNMIELKNTAAALGTTDKYASIAWRSGYGNINAAIAGVYTDVTANKVDIAFLSFPWEGGVGGCCNLVENMRITSKGYVGIGTTAPGDRLEVKGESYHAFIINVPAYGSGWPSPYVNRSIPLAINNTAAMTDNNSQICIWFRGMDNTSSLADLASIGAIRKSGTQGGLVFSTKGAGLWPVARMVIDNSGYVGIGTTNPLTLLNIVTADSGVDTPLYIQDAAVGAANKYFFIMRSHDPGAPDNEFIFRTDGTALADGSWTGGGADYAEWIRKEGELKPGDVIGLNPETGKTRKYQAGDSLVGIYSSNPGFVGGGDNEKSEEEMARDNALVSLMGQVKFDPGQVQIAGGQVYTRDWKQVGSLLNDGRVLLEKNNLRGIIVNANGKVGIGMTSPSYQLQLSTDSATKPSTNTWTIASDSRIKKDIRPYTNGLSIVKRINPVWFKYNGKAGLPQDNQDHIGVIGQEIIKVAPYTVSTFRAKLNPDDKKETELLNFNSHALTFDLINAVKELDANITKLSQENQELKKTDKELKSELENLKTRLSRLEAKAK